MLSITVSGRAAAALANHLSGKPPTPGPSPQALHAPGRIALPPPLQPRSNADGGNAAAMFDAMLARRDADGDGQLSVAETSEGRFSNLISKVFGTIDTDADGLLSQSEMTAAAEMIEGGANLFMLAKAGPSADHPPTAEVAGEALSPQDPMADAVATAPPGTEPVSDPASQAQSVILALEYEDALLQTLN